MVEHLQGTSSIEQDVKILSSQTLILFSLRPLRLCALCVEHAVSVRNRIGSDGPMFL